MSRSAITKAPSKKKMEAELRQSLINYKQKTRMYPTNIGNYIRAGIKPEPGKDPYLVNSYYKALNAIIARLQKSEEKKALGTHPNVGKFKSTLSNLKLFNNNNTKNNATSFSNSQIKTLKSAILQKIYKISLSHANKKPYTVLYKFFDDLYLPQVRKFSKFIGNDSLLTFYIEKAALAIRGNTTKKIGGSEVPIVFNKKQLVTFAVLMWLDSIHDGYYKDTLIKALYDDTSSIFLKHLDVFSKPVRFELIQIIQGETWKTIPVLFALADGSFIDVLQKNGKFDFAATSGKFEAFLKNKIGVLFGAPRPKIIGHTTVLTSDKYIRINMAIDQGDGRIPDALLASQYAKVPGNQLKINNTLTIAGLVDPGRFFLIQRMGYTSLLSGLFNIDEPTINGKIVMDDIKFGFYYKPNSSNNRKQHLFTANYNVEPRTTGGSAIDMITLNLINKSGAVQLRPGTTAKEGDITKFFGDFYQVLINNAYNIDREGGSYYTLGSGDGVMIAMNTFMSGVMGAPIAMFVDSGKLTESRTNQTQPVKLYLPESELSHIQVVSNRQSPTFTNQSSKNKNNNKNEVTSNPVKRPRTSNNSNNSAKRQKKNTTQTARTSPKPQSRAKTARTSAKPRSRAKTARTLNNSLNSALALFRSIRGP